MFGGVCVCVLGGVCVFGGVCMCVCRCLDLCMINIQGSNGGGHQAAQSNTIGPEVWMCGRVLCVGRAVLSNRKTVTLIASELPGFDSSCKYVHV